MSERWRLKIGMPGDFTPEQRATISRNRGRDHPGIRDQGIMLSETPMTQADAWRMVRKRALAVGILAPVGSRSFRATAITAYLANRGTLEHIQAMAGHESPRTTKLYDRTKERLTVDEVERIRL